MATFIGLIQFTEQGLRGIEESPRRSEAFADAAKALGASVKSVYWTSGSYDGVMIVDAPDDKTASTLFLKLARAGNVRTHTLRAYDKAEMTKILADAK